MYKKIDLTKLIVYDIETLINCFVICLRDFSTGTKKEFVFYDDKDYEDQPKKLYQFIKSCISNGYSFVGFNSLNFDSQVIHEFYDWCSEKQDPLYELGSKFIIDQMYGKAQSIINLPEEERFKELVPEGKLFAPQIDIFKQLHYDRPAKATSLKWVEFSMQYPNIQEMPINHDEYITKDQIQEVLDYCWNDVDATFEFFKKVKYETEVRLGMSHEYGINLINASEPRMVREIFATFLTKEMGITNQELRQMKTIRKNIAFSDIIFPYVEFQTKEFKEVLKVFKDKVIDANPHSTDKFKHTFNFRGMEVDLGLGGIHACAPSGVYTHAEDEVIEDADGTSFYPFLAIQNNLYPEHLPAFNKVYPMMYEERKKYDKKDPKNYIFKIVLNSAYGLSKEINSYLYDPKFTYSITINGQLSLLMLVEALNMAVPGIEFIQMNTDGITYKYKKAHEEMVRKICRWWERVTRINLVYAYYDKMVIRDVNNYMAVDTKGNVKKKGIFETEMPFHKNPSSLIIPKALEQYFINNLTPVDYITSPERSIFDFCNGVKKKSNFKLNIIKILSAPEYPKFETQEEIKDFLTKAGWRTWYSEDNWVKDGFADMGGISTKQALKSALAENKNSYGYVEMAEEQQKVTRYIISKPHENAGLFVKDFNDGRRVAVEANKLCLSLNKIDMNNQEAAKYPIDYQDYIKQTQKIIDIIQPPVTQQTLF